MRITVAIKPNAELPLPDDRTLAEAGARGMMNLIYSHLLRRNASARRRAGMPKSDYWADAADSMKVEAAGKVGVVTIDKEGAVLHYYGGIVYPTGGRKSLAIPVHPAVWDQRPAEYDPSHEKLSLVWPKGEKTGTLRDKETDEVVYLLVSKAKIKEDKTVLPTESEMEAAGMSAAETLILYGIMPEEWNPPK